jgi:glycosyltransferase involved in cell wall biosynthesis
MMRVLMLTPDEGHLDRRIAQEAASLARRGSLVDIYPAVDPGLRFDADLAPGVALLAKPGVGPPPPPSRRALRLLRRRLAPVLPPLDRAIEAMRYRTEDRAAAIAAAHLEPILASEPYDLVFAHDVPVFPLAVQIKDAWDIPLICDLHEIFPEQDEHFTTETARRYWRAVERAGLSRADAIISVNQAVDAYVRERYRPAVTSVVVHNSMPFIERAALGGESLRERYGISEDRRVMTFSGSLRPHANVETIILGFAEARIEGWDLAILGSGPLLSPLERLVSRRSLAGRVHLGYRARERELLALVSSADLGLLPYQAVGLNHRIATPNKLFEYLQARVPIATSRLPMIESLLEGTGVGGFVDFSSTESTAAGLRRFVAEVLPSIAPESLERAARRYCWEADEPSLFAAVDSATSGPPR